MRPVLGLSVILSACIDSGQLEIVGTEPAEPVTSGTSTTPTVLDVDITNIAISGRWAGDETALHCTWQGCTARIAFVGEQSRVQLRTAEASEWVRLMVDDDPAQSWRFEVTPKATWFELPDVLSPGEHTLTLIKETYAADPVSLLAWQVEGLEILDAPEANGPHLLVLGDSNAAGVSLMSERDEGAQALRGATFSWPALVARAVGGTHENISVSGATLTSLPRQAPRWDRFDDTSVYTPLAQNRREADLVVINLGANDIYASNTNQLLANYLELLREVRDANPSAHIVAFNAEGWDRDEPANDTPSLKQLFKDDNFSVAIFPWYFEQWHGCETDHAGMATSLLTHLKQEVGLNSAPVDILNGYGEEGDLANGSFERQAPFGGFAWRYADDEGVERRRVEDAKDGDWVLRLTDAEVHQPNDVLPGENIVVSGFARGPGALAVILDTRGQQMGTFPIDEEVEEIVPGNEWTPFTVALRASTNGRPVFHTRLTLASEGLVEIDGLEMTTDIQ